MKILFTGGGTGGHIFPIIAVVREIKKIEAGSDLKLFYIGPKDKFSKPLLQKEGIRINFVLSGKIRRYFSWKVFFQNFVDLLFKIPIGILQSFFHIFFLSPDVIFSKGGFGSIPIVIAGWLLRVPIFLHESDISPGLANRFLSKLALEVFTSFPETEYISTKKIILVGNPIRSEILGGSKEKAQKLFKLSYRKNIILILGGSQGAKRINDKILTVLPKLLENFEIIHQCGESNFKEVTTESKVMASESLLSYYHLFPFLGEEELREALSCSDVVVSRAGSGTIFEIALIGKPSILIPLPEAAQNHQVKNAYAYAKSGAAIVLEEINFTPHFLVEKLRYLLSDPDELKRIQKAAKEFSKPFSAKIIANYLVEFLKK